MPRTTDSKIIQELAEILNETNLSEIEIEKEGLRIRVARVIEGAQYVTVSGGAPAPQIATTDAPASAAPVAAEPAKKAPASGQAVKAPMVGTVYLAPDPNSAPFVKIGDRVKAGQTLFIIEAMKTMNPVAAPHAGTVIDILVDNGQPVEFDEALAMIGD